MLVQIVHVIGVSCAVILDYGYPKVPEVLAISNGSRLASIRVCSIEKHSQG